MRLNPAASTSGTSSSKKGRSAKGDTSGAKGSVAKTQKAVKGSKTTVSFDLPKHYLENEDTEKESRPLGYIKKGAVCLVYWENDYFECRIRKKSKKDKMALVTYQGWNADERVKYSRLSRATPKALKEARSIREDWIRTGRRPRRRVTPPDGRPVRSPVAASGATTPGSYAFVKSGASLLCCWEGKYFPVIVIDVYENRKKARISYTGWEGRPDQLETVAFSRLRKGNTKEFEKARALVRRLAREQVAPKPKVRKVSVKSRK